MTMTELFTCFPMAENHAWDNGDWIELFKE